MVGKLLLAKAIDTDVVENQPRSVNKTLYKLELYSVRLIPVLISIGYFLNTVLAYFGCRFEILSPICGMSLLPLMFIWLSSRVFQFCLRHRLFIYYIAFSEVEAWIDYLFGILLSDNGLFVFDCIMFAMLIVSVIYLKYTYNNK